MKFSYAWLSEWAPTELDAAAAGEVLTMAGLELEEITAAAPALDGVVVGRIAQAAPHPNADRLQVCMVDIAADEPLAIVCGAPNARAGLTVAVATVGTRLPGDFKIKKSKIRGEPSFGMLCSGRELGLEDTPGILELPADLAPGTPLTTALELEDSVLEIALTPNRGDCLSIRGIGRELACLNGSELRPPEFRKVQIALQEEIPITVDDASDCPSYQGRIVRGLDRSATTPLWLSERLRRSGLRAINPLVDVTNYVMLELGQPMHAFDLAKLRGDIQVRRGRSGESLTLLNDQEIKLSAEELLICDESGPIALAGAMGGLSTSVTDDTVDVFLESACFAPSAVAGTGRKHKLSSDSLHRFERGVDPELQSLALDRATALLQDIAGGRASAIRGPGATAQRTDAITLRPERVNRLLGSDIPASRMREMLEALACQVGLDDDKLAVTVPSHRYDLNNEIDLVEEIARIHGYNALPARTPRVPVKLSSPAPDDATQALRTTLVGRGFHEAVSFSFADAAIDNAIQADNGATAIAVDNPIASNLAQMRRSLWASLIPSWKHNAQRQNDRIRLFELGRHYRREDARIIETPVIAGLVSGLAGPEQWGQAKRGVDFFDLKADLNALLAGRAPQWSAESHPALHPGRSAAIRLGEQASILGWAGQIHPRLAKQLDVTPGLLMFEFTLDGLLEDAAIDYQALADTPSTRRDLAFVVDQGVSSNKLIHHLKLSAGPFLREVRVFDVFTGDALPKGCKSVALGLIFQDFSRTLTDAEVDEHVATLTTALRTELNAQIRD